MRFPPPDPAGRAVLTAVLARAGSPGAVVIFDLDSTLLDNRPRQVRILREYGAARGIPELTRSELAHWPHGFGLEEPMRAVGLSDERIRELARDAREFWRERFFTSAYVEDDAAIAGAAAFATQVRDAGAIVAYCTGRHEGMRAGTETVLGRHGFPVPGTERVVLVMKPAQSDNDDAFKLGVPEQLRQLGTVVAAFDNEPTHVNAYRKAFPDALVVHVATDHSGRPVPLAAGVPAIGDFERQ